MSALRVSDRAVGRTYGPSAYRVEPEPVVAFARAVGETNPVHLHLEAAHDAGFRNIVAPVMFVVVYARAAVVAAFGDPDTGIEMARAVQGAQEFAFGELVCAGDEITTTATLEAAYERSDLGFYVVRTSSANDDGKQVCEGVWTTIVRGESR